MSNPNHNNTCEQPFWAQNELEMGDIIQKMEDVTHSMKGYFHVGCRFILISHFLWNLVNDNLSHFVKVTSNEGHHHLTLDIWLVQEFPYIYWIDFKLCVIGGHKSVWMSFMEIYKYFYVLLSIEIMIIHCL